MLTYIIAGSILVVLLVVLVIGLMVRKRDPITRPMPAVDPRELFNAASKGEVDALRAMLEGKGDVNASNSDGVTALIIATKKGHMEVFDLLMAHGANVNARNVKGWMALHVAAGPTRSDRHRAIWRDMGKKLITKGALVNALNSDKDPPLILAVKAGRDDMVALLIESKANLDVQDALGNSPLYYAQSQGRWDIAELLQEAGATRIEKGVPTDPD